MSKIDLYKGDCLDVMDELIAKGESVDLTVTSPPYDNLRNYNNSLQWNENIWKNVIKKLYDISSDDGIVVWVVGDATIDGSETGTSFKQALYFMECGFKLHDTMIYEKNSSTFPARANSNRYTQIFEYMFIFAKGKVPKQLICDKKNKWAGHKDYSGKFKNPVPDFSPRTNIFKYVTSKGKTGIHDAPFPEQLVEDMIISFATKDAVIFDCFLGSGTTGKIAKKLGFSFKGIEKVHEYFEIAKKRIEDTVIDASCDMNVFNINFTEQAGYDAKKCMEETIAEVSSRKGAINQETGKWEKFTDEEHKSFGIKQTMRSVSYLEVEEINDFRRVV